MLNSELTILTYSVAARMAQLSGLFFYPAWESHKLSTLLSLSVRVVYPSTGTAAGGGACVGAYLAYMRYGPKVGCC